MVELVGESGVLVFLLLLIVIKGIIRINKKLVVKM